MCDGNHDCPQTNKSSGGEDEDNCEVSADGNNSQFVAYSVGVALQKSSSLWRLSIDNRH